MSQSILAAVTNCSRLVIRAQHKWLTVVEAGKSKIQVWAGSVSDKGPLPGSQMLPLFGVLTWQKD